MTDKIEEKLLKEMTIKAIEKVVNDEDSMKVMFYATKIFPTVNEMIQDKEKEMNEKFEKLIDEAEFPITMGWDAEHNLEVVSEFREELKNQWRKKNEK